eukprot:2553111-Alexandrium_andersonii.AAC.1
MLRHSKSVARRWPMSHSWWYHSPHRAAVGDKHAGPEYPHNKAAMQTVVSALATWPAKCWGATNQIVAPAGKQAKWNAAQR